MVAISDGQSLPIEPAPDFPPVLPPSFFAPAKVTLANTLLLTYPEESPFDRTPPVPNLSPVTPVENDQTRSISTEKALAELRQFGVNPFFTMYGNNPLYIPDPKVRCGSLPLPPYDPPTPLPELSVDGIEFIELLNPRGRTPVYKVRVDGDVRALKMFIDRDPDEEWDKEEIGWPQFRFRMEKEAYAHLLRSGACKDGIVPYCYGWFTLTQGDIERCCALPENEHDPLRRIKDRPSILTDRRPPKALLLEYFADAQVLSIQNITPDIAEAALRSLCKIHKAYVLHGDPRRHNLFVLPGGRVVWIDFDNSTCGSDKHHKKKLSRQKLFDELASTWTLLYMHLLPDKHVNFTHWLY